MAKTIEERERMFGRVRAASSSPESLEMERPPSNKFLKHHSLSIYETTLMKLREGSRMSTTSMESSITDDPGYRHPAALPDEDAMILDPCHVSSSHSTSSPTVVSAGGSGQRPSSGVSIVYLFAKYNSEHSALGSPSSDGDALESAGCIAATGSLVSVDGQWPESGSSSSVDTR